MAQEASEGKGTQSILDYVNLCMEYVDNPVKLCNGGDPWVKVAAMYVLKENLPEVYSAFWKSDAMQHIGRQVSETGDQTLLMQFTELVAGPLSRESEDYAALEAEVTSLTRTAQKCFFSDKERRRLADVQGMAYELKVPEDGKDAKYIALITRIQSLMDEPLADSVELPKYGWIETGFYNPEEEAEGEPAPAEDAEQEALVKLEPVDTLEFTRNYLTRLEKRLCRIDNSIMDCTFNEQSRKELADVLFEPDASSYLARDRHTVMRKTRLNKLLGDVTAFSREYDAVMDDINNIRNVSNTYAKVCALNALKAQADERVELMVENRHPLLILLEKEVYASDDWALIKRFQGIKQYSPRKEAETRTLRIVKRAPERSAAWKWAVASATSAASVLGGIAAVDHYTRVEQPGEETGLDILAGANRIARYFAEVPGLILDAADFAVEVASEAVAMIPEPKPVHIPEISLDFDKPFVPAEPKTLDFGLGEMPEITLEPFETVPEIELTPIPELNLDLGTGIPEIELELVK